MTEQPVRRPRKQVAVTQAMKDLTDQLCEVLLFEVDPRNWTGNDANGHTMRPNAMIDKALDMRIKCKVNARTTIGLIKEMQQLIAQRETGRTAQRLAANPTTGGDPSTVADDAMVAQETADRLIAEAQNVVKMRRQG